MKKDSIIFFALLLFIQIGLAQDYGNIPLDLSDVIRIEKENHGIPTDTIESFGILKNPHYDLNTLINTKVYIFKRSKDDFNPPLHVWYHFSIDSNKLVGIKYNWGLFNPSFNPSKNMDVLFEISKNEKSFRKKYKSQFKELNSMYGKPIKEKTIRDDKEVFIQNVFWEDSEKIVSLSIRFDRIIKEIPVIGTMANPHIEIGLTWK